MTAPHQNLLGTSGAVDTEETDPNFNQTVLLLHGNGTNGGQNNTFVDSSTNNLSITRTGTPTQGTFNPFLGDGQYSNFFNGAETLSTTLSSAIGTGDMTIEFWYLPNVFADYQTLVSVNANGSRTNGFNIGTESSQIGRLKFVNGDGSSGNFFSSNNVLAIGVWSHIALTREGSTVRLFHNGSQLGSVSNSTNWSGTIVGIGGRADDLTAERTKGFIMNVNLVVGTAKYDASGYTTPSSLISAHGNTKLLTCQSNRFVDNSASPLTLTVAGTPKVVPFSPFAPTASYSESVHGGSGYFEGNGNYLISDGSTDLALTPPYTLEAWVYPLTVASSSGEGNIIAVDKVAAVSGVMLGLQTDSIYLAQIGTGLNFPEIATTNNTHEWMHIAAVVNGTGSNEVSIYKNGVRIGQGTNNSTFSDSHVVAINADDRGIGEQTVFISSARVSNNARYSGSSYTIPTAPFANDSNTKFLANFTNASIIDSTMKNNLETVNETQIDTGDKKFGTGSLVFDGDDYLVAVNTEPRRLFTPNGGDMTWEMFVKFDVLDSLHCLFSKYGSGSEYQFYYDNGNTDWRLVYHTSVYTWDDNSITTGTWYHIALVKDGTTHYLFKNGTSLGTNTATENTTLTGRPFVLGCSFNGPNSPLYQLKGKLDEVRVTRVARYTSNFTAPTKAFANR